MNPFSYSYYQGSSFAVFFRVHPVLHTVERLGHTGWVLTTAFTEEHLDDPRFHEIFPNDLPAWAPDHIPPNPGTVDRTHL